MPTVHLYQPPILGVGASVRFLEGGHTVLGTLGDFGSQLARGFTLGIDLQSEKKTEQVVCGSLRSNRTGFAITYNDSDTPHLIKIHIRDDSGRELIATAALSDRAGKRLFLRINPVNNLVTITELTSHSFAQRSTSYLTKDSPQEFSNFDDPIILSGCMIDGTRKGNFVGRTAQVALWNIVLGDDQIDDLKIATFTEIASTYGQRTALSPDIERREVFLDDLAKLRQWKSQASLARSSARDASTVIFKWLFDKRPLLLDLCDEVGIQLSFPGTSQEGRRYIDKILASTPSFYQLGVIGAGAPHGFNWKPLAMFRDDIAFQVGGHTVTHESFVKLVRHKLGGAHFDKADRQKWQRDLKAYSDQMRLGEIDAICYQMKMLIRAVIQAVEGCGIEQQLLMSDTAA
jgi:hypothetical protein